MKGVVFPSQGAAPQVVDNLNKPTPADDQVLVKSLYAAINPVDAKMSEWGVLVTEWPLVMCCDAAGVVVAAGKIAESKYNLKPGTYVCGCTRLGFVQYSACQEFFLMDAAITIPKPSNISVQESATIGVGTYTACLGLFVGLKIPMPDLANLPTQHEGWVVVLGGASSVGKFAVQLAKASGYKVLASCSPKNKTLLEELGAESFDYKMEIADQIKTILDVTGGKVHGVFDTIGEDDPLMTKMLFSKLEGQKLFATTNDWSEISDFEDGKTYGIAMGYLGRKEYHELNSLLESYIPFLKGSVEKGILKPSGVKLVGEGNGWDGVIEAFEFQKSGKGGSDKVVCKIADK